MTLLAAKAAAPILRILVMLVDNQCKAEQRKAKQSDMSLAFPLGFRREACATNKATTSPKNGKWKNGRKEKKQRNERVDEERDSKKMKKREQARKMEIVSSHPPPGNKSNTTIESRCH